MLVTIWESRWLPDLRGISSVGRAPALQAGGQGFESLYLHDSHEQCPDERVGSTQVYLRESTDDRTDSAKHVTK